MRVSFDTRVFDKDMKNIMDYATGFLEGVQSGKRAFLTNLGSGTAEYLKEFIDANARVNPELLDHVYEWYQTGSPSARLYDIDYTVSNLGLSMKSTFRQSTSIQKGSKVPFYNKAMIMEKGIPVTIKPKSAKVLSFEVDGEQVFTKKPVTVAKPGGPSAQGGFERTFDLFFSSYFSQAFLKSSGVAKVLSDPAVFKKNLKGAKQGGRSLGSQTGYRWIANAGVIA